jgi:ion channel
VADEKPLRITRRSFRHRLEEGDTYGLLLILIIAAYFEMALIGTSHWGKTVLSLSFAGILLLTLHTSHVRGRWVRITIVVSVFVVTVNFVQAVVDSEAFTGATYIWIGFIVASPIVILNRIFRHPTVDLETILGAICSYLLIGIAFASIYGMLQTVGSENFFAQPGSHERIDFLYFSFIVLTTTGFGDLTPGTSVGKVLVTLEALIGQVFLVTIVASLISSFVGTRGRRAEVDGAAEGDADGG